MARRSVVEYLELFRRYGSATACVDRRGYRTVRWSYRRLADTAAQFARELEARSIGRGQHVLLWGGNGAEWLAAFWGCALRGAVVVPMDAGAAPRFARRVAGQVEARLAVCSRAQAQHLPGSRMLVLEDLAQTIAGHSATPFPASDLERRDTLEILFTSGTTDEPKGVVLTHGNLLANWELFESEIAKHRHYARLFRPLRFLNLVPL
ncbi:MAG: AMP-binding protein, partial [Terriglobia bacterium]